MRTMITSLNPRLSLALSIMSFLLMLYLMMYDINSMLGFVTGMILTYPLISGIWKTITKNWKSVFKPFYSKSFHKRKIKIILKSWKLTWWLAPYCLLVYGLATTLIMIFFNSLYVVHGLLLGSVFEAFWFVHKKSHAYYKQLVRYSK
ncbi:MAG: hypothetical protein HZB66_02990 [Candidatus Aenigmarchaeota archaeon]|nr:hypothetical protein [Candidatus Aenigmarchaeota archaeon]